jgi:GrpB-like predicted nucleotidyltransferase (UPF0157 family)
LDRIEIHLYDAQWPRRFQKEAARIAWALGDQVIRIEHIGSTAVPGIAAKPVIDIMVGLDSLDDGSGLIAPLAELGYAHWYEDPARGERLYFVRWSDETRATRLSHIHAAPVGGVLWKEVLLFRDRLRADPILAAEYESLKQALAERHSDDRDAYTAAKSDFVRRITRPSAHGGI